MKLFRILIVVVVFIASALAHGEAAPEGGTYTVERVIERSIAK